MQRGLDSIIYKLDTVILDFSLREFGSDGPYETLFFAYVVPTMLG
jgi:hypothetical protein